MRRNTTLLALGICGVAALSSRAQAPVEGPAPTSAVVFAESKSGAALDPHALQVQVNGHDAQITGVQPVAAQPAQVAILIDSGLRSSFDLQLREITQFVQGLPPNVQVLIGYMENGSVRSTGNFTADHEQVLASLHIPFSAPGISASPYFCLQDFIKHWPSSERAPRFVLMITNGVDPYNGRPSVLNQDSPYVQSAQDDAARAGVPVYSIYFPDAGLRGGRGSFSGQSYLAQVGDATGGISFNQGSIPPVSISPYLKQFQQAINESYLVTFLANVGNNKAGNLDRLKIKTSQSGVKLHAPSEVHPGLAE